MTSKPGSGFALITTLLFLSLLIVMVSSLFLVVRTKLFQSKTYHDSVAAFYLAELAVADAMGELGADPSWTSGFSNKTIPGVSGHYSLSFNTTGAPFASHESVNNFDGNSHQTYRGPLTINPGQCLLVARATVGQSTRTVEALVDLGGGFLPVDSPLIVDGRIEMSGKVTVEGVESLGYPSTLPVTIHSNLTDSAPDLIQIDDTDCRIEGTVSSSSSHGGAVNLGSYIPTAGSPVLGAPQQSTPPINIAAMVSSKSGANAVPGGLPPVFDPSGSGSPAPAFLDVTTLRHEDGPEFYHSGNLTVGDLDLEGAALYVDGNLTVNGSIEGVGTLWVRGDTSFHGSSKVTFATPDRVAVYSQGNVELTGFDGTILLQQYSMSGPNAAAISSSVSSVTTAMAGLESMLPLVVDRTRLGHQNVDGLDVVAGGARVVIGSGRGSTLSTAVGSAGHLVLQDPGWNSGGHHLTFPVGGRLLFSRAASPARDFLIRRFYELYQFHYGDRQGGPIEVEAYAQAKNGRLVWGGVDAINDFYYLPGVPLLQAFYENFDLGYIGTSYFQGQIYTNGFFHSQNDVTVVGAVITDVDPAARAGADITDGIPDPGDVILENGSRILFVEEFFEARPNRSSGGFPGVRVKVWCPR